LEDAADDEGKHGKAAALAPAWWETAARRPPMMPKALGTVNPARTGKLPSSKK
jgi:hypothetical protein